MMRHVVLAAAALLGTAVAMRPALAQIQSQVQPQAPSVEVTQAWARATTSSARVGGVFLTIKASGAADRMVAAQSPVAEKVELHETLREGTVMKMREVGELPLLPGEAVVMKPGGYHIMLMGLKRPLNRGDSFPITITFGQAPPVTTTVTVQAAGAAGPGHQH